MRRHTGSRAISSSRQNVRGFSTAEINRFKYIFFFLRYNIFFMTLPRESTAKPEEQQWYETNILNGSHVGLEE